MEDINLAKRKEDAESIKSRGDPSWQNAQKI